MELVLNEGNVLLEKRFKRMGVLVGKVSDDIPGCYFVRGVSSGSRYKEGDVVLVSPSYINHGVVVVDYSSGDSYIVIPEGGILGVYSGDTARWFSENFTITMKEMLSSNVLGK